MDHPKTIAWDKQLKAMFDRIDHDLEGRYSGVWKLRHNRPEHGTTANPEADGLFNVGVFFTPGYGSGHGRGYLVEIILATDEPVPAQKRVEMELLVRDLLIAYLPEYFPGRNLSVDRDGSMYKIHGETGLGTI